MHAFLVIGYLLFVIRWWKDIILYGYLLLVIGYWLLEYEKKLFVIRYLLLAIRNSAVEVADISI